MRVTAYEVAVYPEDKVTPELNMLLLIDMKRDDLDVQYKSIFVHIPSKIQPLTKFSVEAK